MLGPPVEPVATRFGGVCRRSVQLGSVGTQFSFHPDFQGPLSRWLREVPDSRPDGAAMELSFALRRAHGPGPGTGATLDEGASGRLLLRGDRLYCDGPDGTGGEVDLTIGSGRIWAPVGHPDACWRAIHHCLRPLWYAALARRGLHPLHASAVAAPGGAICVAGQSGAGKSTLAARLAQMGARFLSDDVCFLDEVSLEVVGLGDYSRLRPGSDPALVTLDADPNGKRPATIGTPTHGPGRARLLVLLAPVTADATTWRVARPADAMATLMTSGFLGLDPVVSARRMQTLARLVQRCPAVFVDRGSTPPSDQFLASLLDGSVP